MNRAKSNSHVTTVYAMRGNLYGSENFGSENFGQILLPWIEEVLNHGQLKCSLIFHWTKRKVVCGVQCVAEIVFVHC